MVAKVSLLLIKRKLSNFGFTSRTRHSRDHYDPRYHFIQVMSIFAVYSVLYMLVVPVIAGS